MRRNWMKWLIFAGTLIPWPTSAQQTCTNGMLVEGTITDPTGAVIPGAQVRATNGETAMTDTAGHYVLSCVPATSTTLTVQADGFADGSASARAHQGESAHVNLRLAVASVETDVQVGADASGIDSSNGTGTVVLGSKEIQQLPDDPDDLLQELQVLAASSGGDPSSALIVVDGFQNGSAMPPKSSIASIRINPDIFAPEYQNPAWRSGRIEITTKIGADSFHGALFLTDSDSSFNATDPFSVTPTPAGKRRYGFELSGPVLRKKVDFSLNLEKRDIDEFNVVNAISLDSNGNQTPVNQSVQAPQRLWIASARTDWQVSSKDLATLSFSSNVNNLGNQGVGGLTLAEAGYDSLASEYDLRFHNTLTLNPNLLHETRIGYSWKRAEQTPLSSAPSLQVAGYFTGGGSTSQNLNDRERDLEIDDEVMATHGKREIKFGIQALGIFVHNYDPDTFNGQYVFGGGSAPALDANGNPAGGTTTISGLEQYRRALRELPGGAPTTYQITTGTPLVPFTQWRFGFYLQDNAKLAPHLSLGTGLRYQFLTNPAGYTGLDPRIGISWAPDKKESWVFHFRVGVFTEPLDLIPITAVERLNGVRQRQSTIYSPSYDNPLTPIPGSIQVSTVNQLDHSYGEGQVLQVSAVIEHDFPHNWHATASYNFGGNWQETRALNINAPMVVSSSGIAPDPIAALLAPRPIAPNENIIQYEQSGHSRGDFYEASIDQHSYKRFGFHLQYWYLHFRENPLSPQSAYSAQGESARPDWMRHGGVAFVGNGSLPYKIDLATQFTAMPGRPFNITTGTDANGDGNFNDRPAYATAPGAGTYSTRYGLLTSNAVNGNVPYNAGTMPGVLYLDANLSRAFTLNPQDKDHPRTLTFNARSANLLNHTNVNAVNTVLSSSSVGQPIAAEPARRVELGVRFAF
jgi:Carboxypeptidase regulatory-like domain